MDRHSQESEGSDSGSDESQESFDTSKLQLLLENLYDDITDSVHELKNLRKKVKGMNQIYRLKKEAQRIFKRKDASVQDIIDFWMPLWKAEGRITNAGIRLGEEALLLNQTPETQISPYDLCKAIGSLFAAA
jgi:hypothetical protein